MSGHALWRATWLFVLLDSLTYVLVDLVALPMIGPMLGDLPVPVVEAVLWVVTAVRILLLGLVVARSLDKRIAGIEKRHVVIAVGTAAAVAAVLGIAVSIASAAVFSVEPASVLNVSGVLLLWIVAGAGGALLARPGTVARELTGNVR